MTITAHSAQSKNSMGKNINELPAATALDGTELVEVLQGGVNSQTTAQDIADLGEASGVVSQTVTGTAETPIIIYADIPAGTHYFSLKWKAICTVQGNGTTVVGEGAFGKSESPATSSAINGGWIDSFTPIEDVSFAGFAWDADVDSGDLRFLFTPPTSAGSTTQIVVTVKVDVL